MGSSGNVELVRRSYEAILRGDVEEGLAVLAPDVRWDGVPGVDPCIGRDEVEHNVRQMVERGASFVVEEVVDGGDRVLVALRPGDSAAFERADLPEPYLGSDRLFNVVTVRDGKVVHLEDHLDRREALASIGVPAGS